MKISAEVVNKCDLTDRESEVLKLMCENQPNKGIARILGISFKTVSTHVDKVYMKLQVRNASINARSAAITKALESGMVRLSNPNRSKNSRYSDHASASRRATDA